MKVTFCTRESDKVSGGQNTWLCWFLPELSRRGIEPRLLCFTSSAKEELPTVRSLRQSGISCTTASREERRYTEQGVRWLLEQLAEDPPDVFVSNMIIPAAYYAGRWLREAGIPTVGICHGGGMYEFYPGLLDEFVLGRAPYKVSALVCVSKDLEQDVVKRNPKGVLLRRIFCGVSVPDDMARKLTGQLRLVYVGQLVEERKRISEVTNALCRAVREVPGTEASIYGDGPDRGIVEQIIQNEDNGLPVRLVGFVESDEIRKRLLESHVIVLLSDHEGLPVSVLEAMACGVVPIGLRGAPGVTELVVDGVTGLLVDDRSEGLVAAVRRLREDPALWERLALSARARVEADYSLDICTTRWRELLENLVNSSGSPKRLRIPWQINLPPVHAALVTIDERVPRPHQRLIGRTQRLLCRMKYQYRSIFDPQ